MASPGLRLPPWAPRELVLRVLQASVRAWEHAGACARASRPHLARVARAGAGLVRRHPAAALALAVRLCWWTAFALLLRAGPVLLGYPGAQAPSAGPFVLGLVLCAVTSALAPSRPLRILGVAQGSLHGAFLVLLWLTAPP